MPHVPRLLPALLALTALAAPATAPAQQPVADPGGPLVYVFSLDGLDGDRVDAGKAPYLGRLLLGQEGGRATYWRESRSVMVAETNPNHVAMATGAFGDRSGIPGNGFAVYDAAAKRACAGGEGADDPNAPAETDGTQPGCMAAESFFAAAERQQGDGITSAAIMGKPKLASIFATKRVDGSYDADHLWTPCTPGETPEPYCRGQGRPSDGYATTDAQVMDEVVRTVEDGVDADGARKRPNLTFVNFPTIDSAGHALGAGAAYDEAIAMMDEQLRRFVETQKRLGLWERTVLFVVSDHSMDTTPVKTSLRARFALDGLESDVVVVQNGSVDMVYLKDRSRPDRAAVLKALRESALKERPQVIEALYREPNPLDGGIANTLDGAHQGWRVAGPRTGDLVVTHAAGGAFNEPNPLTGNHGGPQTSDNTFAVISGGPQVRQQTLAGERETATPFDDTLLNPMQAQNVDVAPTVMALLGRTPPMNNEGRVLTEAFLPGVLPAAAAQVGGGAAQSGSAPCAVSSGFRSVTVRPRGRGLRVAFARRSRARVAVDVFQQSAGRRVLGNRLVARFRRRASFTWRGRARRGARLRDGELLVRVRTRAPDGRADVRRYAVRRRRGRFASRPAFDLGRACGLVRSAKLVRGVFGGPRNRELSVAFRVGVPARVSVDVLRGGRVVRRLGTRTRRPGLTHRVRLAAERLRRGDHVVRLTVVAAGERRVVRLVARRL
jgi:predicted AlkP superfamily pyrophosphatase or phosphodiesterase